VRIPAKRRIFVDGKLASQTRSESPSMRVIYLFFNEKMGQGFAACLLFAGFVDAMVLQGVRVALGMVISPPAEG
jgi:hypothetical protein